MVARVVIGREQRHEDPGGFAVDRVEGDRIKLTKKDGSAEVEGAESSHAGHHHYIDGGLVAEVEGDTVRLSANADVAVTFETEEDGSAI